MTVLPKRHLSLLNLICATGCPVTGAQAQSEADDRTTWDHTECVHEQYWKDAGASFETMCDMVNSWISGFGEGTNAKIKHTREKAIATGDSECLNAFELS